MYKCLRSVLLLSTIVALATPACSRDPSPGARAAVEADGERLMRQMSDTLAAAPAFRFDTTESLEQIGPLAERRVLRFSRRVTVRRPDAMSFELRGAADTPADLAGYYDGRTVSLLDNAHGVWAQTIVPGKLDEMLDEVARKYSLPVPIADVIYSVPYDAFIGRNTTGGLVGRETVDGLACARLAYTDEFVDVRVWIPFSGQPLPRRVELVYKQAPGAPTARIDFTNWDLSPRIADEAFVFEPHATTTQIAFEQFVAAMLAGGDPKTFASPGQATLRDALPK